MGWNKKTAIDTITDQMKAGQIWVYVETNSTKKPYIESSELSQSFLNAAAPLDNGNQGCVVGFEDTEIAAAQDFVDLMKKRSDVVNFDGPNVIK